MNIKYTKEPWQINRRAALMVEDARGYSVESCDGRSDNRVDPEVMLNELQANATRIVECGNACAGMDNPQEQRISLCNQLALAKEQLAECQKGAERYCLVRRLNPREFAEIYDINIKTGVHFDHLISKIIQDQAMSEKG
jgi:hypothetical protein